jgi:hypothetical protein
MPEKANRQKAFASTIPPDNPQRNLAIAQPDSEEKSPYIGAVGHIHYPSHRKGHGRPVLPD